jgi:hypothetical protein
VSCWKLWDTQKGNEAEAVRKMLDELMPFKDASSVQILNYTPRYMAIPGILSAEENMSSDFWALANGTHHQEKIIANKVIGFDIDFLHSISESIHELILQFFPQSEWRSIQSLNFVSVLPDFERVPIRIIFIQQHVHICVFKDSKIVLSRAYTFTSPEDVLWHILNIVKQLGFSAQEVVLYPEGLIHLDSSVFHLLDQYFDRASLPDQHQFRFSSSDTEYSRPTWIHLDRILTCV